MAQTISQSVAWFKRYQTLTNIPVGSVGSHMLRKSCYSAKTRSAFGLARNNFYSKKMCTCDIDTYTYMCTFVIAISAFVYLLRLFFSRKTQF